MPKEIPDRIGLLQGTLDMLILRTLLFGPAHGHQIAKHLQRTTDDVLQVEHGSLYPALHRLERREGTRLLKAACSSPVDAWSRLPASPTVELTSWPPVGAAHIRVRSVGAEIVPESDRVL